MNDDNNRLEEESLPPIGSYWMDKKDPQIVIRIVRYDYTHIHSHGIMIKVYNLHRNCIEQRFVDGLVRYYTFIIVDEV